MMFVEILMMIDINFFGWPLAVLTSVLIFGTFIIIHISLEVAPQQSRKQQWQHNELMAPDISSCNQSESMSHHVHPFFENLNAATAEKWSPH